MPREASNDYRGSPIALYTFGVLTAVFLTRSLIHFLKGDSGVNLPLLVIASLMLVLSIRTRPVESVELPAD